MATPVWKLGLRPASFRGVEFKVAGHEYSSGRRGTDHQFAERDFPFAEDSGREARRYGLDAYVLGQDYFAARDRLIAACELSGPGTLVHPYLGTRRVVCRSVRVVETSRRGGFVRFALAFVEAGDPRVPDVDPSPAQELRSAVDVARQTIQDTFAAVFQAATPDWLYNTATTLVKQAAGAYDDLLVGVRETVGDVDAYRRAVLDLEQDAAALVLEPVELASRITNLSTLLAQLPALPQLSIGLLLRLGEWDPTPRPSNPQTTPMRLAEYRNEHQLLELVRRNGSIGAAGAILDAGEPSGRTQAEAVRTAVTDSLEARILAAEGNPDEDRSRQALSEVYEAATAYVCACTGATLEVVAPVEIAEPAPAVVLSMRFYQTPDRAGDLVARNGIRHPGFVPAGVPLEVLIGVEGDG